VGPAEVGFAEGLFIGATEVPLAVLMAVDGFAVVLFAVGK